MHIFYTPDLLSDSYTLSESESKHCIRVLRLKEKDRVQLIDGKGNLCVAEIIEAIPKRCSVKIIETTKNYGKRDFNISIGIAPTKNISRFETFTEKVTEIGIDKIIPFNSRFSERTTIKNDRIEKVIISAAKQSVKAYMPNLSNITDFKTLINMKFDGQKFIAHCYDSPKENLINLYKKNNNVLIIIGPEGDFSIEEIEAAKSKGFIEVNLSDSRLRTETAGIVACNIIHLANTIK